MNMSANCLPKEILQFIFENLNGKDILECAKVCQQWKDAVDAISDHFWNKLCAKEHSAIYEDAYRKANLSWRELYSSLALWSEVANAKVSIHRTSLKRTIRFQILENSILSCPQRVNSSCPEDFYDTITYYDLTTSKEIKTESFDIHFKEYAESDKIIVFDFMRNNDRLLRVIAKADKHTLELVPDEYEPWVVYENELYYKTPDFELCRVQLVKKDNREALEIETLDNSFASELDAVTRVSSEQINILGSYGCTISIFSVIGKEVRRIGEFGEINTQSEDPIEYMKERGFAWPTRMVFYWLKTTFEYDIPWISQYNVTSACIHYKAVLTATSCSPLTIHVFQNPYSSEGKLELHKVAPNLSIDLEPYKIEDEKLELNRRTYGDDYYKYIKLIDVVETLNGHKIVVLFYCRVLVIELGHNASRKRPVSPTIGDGPDSKKT